MSHATRDMGLHATPKILVLEPGRADRQYWADIWEYRELLGTLAWRDLAVRYKQTVFGIAWALIRPLLTIVVFSVVFGHVAKLPSEAEVPYPLVVFAGMLPWFLFSTTIAEAANSLVSNSNLISKVYFPRIIIPLSATAVGFVDFTISLALFLIFTVWYGVVPTWKIAFLPVAILLCLACSLGPALLLTCLNVKFRDFRFVIPFILQFGIYVSPVGFTSSALPEQLRLILCLNPITGVIDAFRWCLFESVELYLPSLIVSTALSSSFLALGIAYFRRTEKSFADII